MSFVCERLSRQHDPLSGKEIEGPLRKKRTLAAVRRSARVKERERACEKQKTKIIDDGILKDEKEIT